MLALFMLLAWRGRRRRSWPRIGSVFISIGIVAMVSIQALVNIGVVTGSLLIPVFRCRSSVTAGRRLFSLAAIGVLLIFLATASGLRRKECTLMKIYSPAAALGPYLSRLGSGPTNVPAGSQTRFCL